MYLFNLMSIKISAVFLNRNWQGILTINDNAKDQELKKKKALRNKSWRIYISWFQDVLQNYRNYVSEALCKETSKSWIRIENPKITFYMYDHLFYFMGTSIYVNVYVPCSITFSQLPFYKNKHFVSE